MPYIDRLTAARLELANAWRGVCYASAVAHLWPARGAEILSVAGAYAVYGGAMAPVNHVMGLGALEPVAPEDWAHIAHYYRRHGAPAQINVCPLGDPSVMAGLAREGYLPSRFYAVLALPLSEFSPTPPSPSVAVRPMAPAEAMLWLNTCAQGFAGKPEPPAETMDLLRPNLASENARAYLAFVDGQPAGTAASFYHQGVVELGSDAVLPAMRRRGVHRALVAARLADAHAAGCDLAMAITVPGSDSQRNLQRLGFELAYHRLVAMRSTP